MNNIVPLIITVIIALQLFFFVRNIKRMNEFKRIFVNDNGWKLTRNENGFVSGITGYEYGNSVFTAIIASINKYLGNSAGSIIDFNLIKDAIDRHCDTVENDINTQTPIPLYLGLAGTMAGVIVGLFDLLSTGSISTLMNSGTGNIDTAAAGINDLLWGVAWAMGASICGILLTTINSIYFKNCKLKEENGKNTFLAWLQSRLLPELPTDTSDALNQLVGNLNEFNTTFANNTVNLGKALNEVNTSYAIQAEIISQIHDMDVVQMAKANVKVLKELQQCTDRLEQFNRYLNDINGYTDAIHRFEEQFQAQENRLQILEEIKDFFNRHKESIAVTMADADSALQMALSEINESASENIKQLNSQFVELSTNFTDILQQEKETFEKFNRQLTGLFDDKLKQMPELEKQLSEISAIPAKLDELALKIEKSNSNLAQELQNKLYYAFNQANEKAVNAIPAAMTTANGTEISASPKWIRIASFVALIIIALTCVMNAVTYFIPQKEQQSEVTALTDGDKQFYEESTADNIAIN